MLNMPPCISNVTATTFWERGGWEEGVDVEAATEVVRAMPILVCWRRPVMKRRTAAATESASASGVTWRRHDGEEEEVCGERGPPRRICCVEGLSVVHVLMAGFGFYYHINITICARFLYKSQEHFIHFLYLSFYFNIFDGKVLHPLTTGKSPFNSEHDASSSPRHPSHTISTLNVTTLHVHCIFAWTLSQLIF
jgi:hypothetical protein